MFRWRRRRITLPDRYGFTLIELMVVVALIAILTAIAVPLYQNLRGPVRTARALAEIRTIASALVQYAAGCGGLPAQPGDSCNPGGGAPGSLLVV